MFEQDRMQQRGMPLRERKAWMKSKLEDLGDSLVRDPAKLLEFSKGWANGFHRYSMRNYILAQVQHPGATLLAGYGTWKKKGRQVKAGEASIWILGPRKYEKEAADGTKESGMYFTPVRVFDISQTEGDDVELGNTNLVQGELSFDLVEEIASVPVTVGFVSGGLAKGCTDGKSITVAPADNEADMVSTLLHEEAHIRLGHTDDLGTFTESEAVNAKEIAAEATKFIVLSAFGMVDEQAPLYIGGWSKHEDELHGQGEVILKTAERIIKDIEANVEE